jgi:hypothetical protein
MLVQETYNGEIYDCNSSEIQVSVVCVYDIKYPSALEFELRSPVAQKSRTIRLISIPAIARIDFRSSLDFSY